MITDARMVPVSVELANTKKLTGGHRHICTSSRSLAVHNVSIGRKYVWRTGKDYLKYLAEVFGYSSTTRVVKMKLSLRRHGEAVLRQAQGFRRTLCGPWLAYLSQ